MRLGKYAIALLIAIIAMTNTPDAQSRPVRPAYMKKPVEEGIWVRPTTGPAEPVIGFKDGIRIALWPASTGPRGIIRILTPYVFSGTDRELINFIALEPIVRGHRSLSELEMSALDDAHGKRLWFTDSLTPAEKPPYPWYPGRGTVSTIRVGGKEIETLSIYIHAEKLDNGAIPIVQAIFRADRPNEVTFKSLSGKDSAEMESCVLSSTMANFGRCRLLWLKDEILDSRKVWPGYDGHEFQWTGDIAMDRIRVEKDGGLIAAITSDEADPGSVEFEPKWWAFNGKPATQYWRKYPGTIGADVRVRVNGRARFYGTATLIPGGIAYENFEMIEPFVRGQEITFGVTLKTPEQLGWRK